MKTTDASGLIQWLIDIEARMRYRAPGLWYFWFAVLDEGVIFAALSSIDICHGASTVSR